MSKAPSDNQYFGTEKTMKILFKLAPPVMLAQLIQVMSAGQEIYFDNREWAGKLAPAINTELGKIAKEAAYR